MYLKHTALLFAAFLLFATTSCTGELEEANAQLKKELAEAKSQLEEQTKISDFAKEQAKTAKRRADEAEKALAECNGAE